MESFLAGRASVQKTRSADSPTTPGSVSAVTPTAMNMDAFESLFSPAAPGSPSGGDQIAAGALASAANCQKAPGGVAPSVEVVRENGTVRRVIVICGCGERIELECDY